MRKQLFWRLGIGVRATATTSIVLGGTPAVADPVQSGQVLVADTEQRAHGAQDRATIECFDTHTRVDPTTGHLLE
jgi:hypothetical protein